MWIWVLGLGFCMGILLGCEPQSSTCIEAEHRIHFEEVTEQAGIGHIGATFGASWGDFNGDGLPDLWVGNHHFDTPNLYLNLGEGRFRDIAPEVWPGPHHDSHGAAWADFDEDGDQDLMESTGSGNANFLWVNEAGRLVDRAAQFGVDSFGSRGRTPLWFDWNRDGLLDLVLTQSAGRGVFPHILHNTGIRFIDSTNLVGETFFGSEYAQLADMTEDGYPDLVLEYYIFPGKVYDLTQAPFEDVASLLNLPNQGGAYAQDTVIADFTGDGRNDIFVTKFGSNQQLVVRNQNNIEFRFVAVNNEKIVRFVSSGIVNLALYPEDTFAGSSTSPQDVIRIGEQGNAADTNFLTLDPSDSSIWGLVPYTVGVDDGLFIGFDPDTSVWTFALSTPNVRVYNAVVTSTLPMSQVEAVGFQATPFAYPPNLYVRTDQGFVEGRQSAGLDFGMPCQSAVGADFDNDMDFDLYLACSETVSNEPNFLLENLGNGTFANVPGAAGAAGSMDGRSETTVIADYDEDGFVDVFLTNGAGGVPFSDDGPHQLFRNRGNQNHWIEIDLVGTRSNIEAIGAEVSVSAGGRTQKRLQDGGMHRYAQNHKRLHFGLGGCFAADEVEIKWPSGAIQVLTDVPSDRILSVIEPMDSSCGTGFELAIIPFLIGVGISTRNRIKISQNASPREFHC